MRRIVATAVILILVAFSPVFAGGVIRINFQPNLESLPLLLGDEKGFYKEEDITLKWVKMPSTGTAANLLLVGELDVYASGAGTALVVGYELQQEFLARAKDEAERSRIAAQGWPLRIVYMITAKTPGWLLARPEYHVLADLPQGAVIGVNEIGTFTQRYAEACFRGVGVNPNKFRFVRIGGSNERLRALASKTMAGREIIVATPLWPPHAQGALAAGLNKLWGQEVCPPTLGDGIVVTRQTIQNRREVIQRFIQATRRSVQYVLDSANKLEVLAFMEAKLGLQSLVNEVLVPLGAQITTREFAEAAYRESYSGGTLSPNGTPPLNKVRELAKLMLGEKAKGVRPEDFTEFFSK